MGIKKSLALFLVLVLLFSLLPQLVFANGCRQQIWYLDGDEDPDPGPVWADYIMYRSLDGEHVNENVYYIEVGGGNSVVWEADEPAETAGVTFGEGVWDGKIMMAQGSSYDLSNITVRIGYIDGSDPEDFHSFADTTLAGQEGNSWNIHYHITADSFTVPQGAYLALQLYNGTTGTIEVGAGFTHNWLRSPCDDPGYPTPELPALALLAIGLVGLGGYIAIRRKRTGEKII